MAVGELIVSAVSTARPIFVLHEHDKPRHHYDLRLEEDGVLRSWAVPRGLPTDPARNRLAVPVSDHDLEHAAQMRDVRAACPVRG